MSELLALGISHQTAPVELRERLGVHRARGGARSRAADRTAEVREAVALSHLQPHRALPRRRRPAIRAGAGPTRWRCSPVTPAIRPTELARAIYSPRNCDAARHLYRVTAGLESMIVGEAEIQGQVKRAFEAALRAGCTGPLSNRLFAAALTAGKRVRSETGDRVEPRERPLGGGRARRELLGDLRERHVVIIGAGETSELTAQALADRGAGTIFVANRHADARAQPRAALRRLRGRPRRAAGAAAQRRHRRLLHLLPTPDRGPRGARAGDRPTRGAAAAVDRHRGAARHRPPLRRARGRDAVRHRRPPAVVARNLDTRADEVPRAEEIVEEEIRRFAGWLGQLEALPTVSALRERGDAIVEQVLAENDGRWESASPRDLARVEALARVDREPPPARAHDPPAQPLGDAAPTPRCSSCASCSRCRRTRRRSRAPPAGLAKVARPAQPPRAADAARHQGQRARARTGRPRRRGCSGAGEIVTIATAGDEEAAVCDKRAG